MHTRRLTTIELGINDEQVAVSDHIAYFWETDEQFKDAIGFLEIGLRGKDSCVLFGHRDANDKVLSVLESRGFDLKQLEHQGRIRMLGGKTSGQDMLSEIAEWFKQAVAAGAPLIRLLGNIGWGHPDWPGESDTLEFEARVTAACKTFPCIVLCMYDVSQLSGRIIHGAYETHPLTICGNVLRENPHCVPIDTFLTGLRASKATA
ncbi:MAG TPA: MEDS domain-containing protein [Candidatus Dormibacteraeota bacterium]|nr:MEDS domain-containing protein [Candidatus Dormibacteraeota bacterium]